jgi:HAD superfamily hydrolase (TIGR01509 family)
MVKVVLFDFFGVLLRELNADGDPLLNQELLTFLRPLKERYQLGVYTNSFDLLNTPSCHSAISSLFHKIFFAKQLNLPKSQPESYFKIAKELKVKPEEIVFVDDTHYNVIAAEQAGVTAFFYQSNHELFEHLQPVLGL